MKLKDPFWVFFVLWAVFGLILGGFMADYYWFRHQGARFTGIDGQELCLRVKALDGLPCEYSR